MTLNRRSTLACLAAAFIPWWALPKSLPKAPRPIVEFTVEIMDYGRVIGVGAQAGTLYKACGMSMALWGRSTRAMETRIGQMKEDLQAWFDKQPMEALLGDAECEDVHWGYRAERVV